jgi:prevent-host-death family protein
MDRPKETPVTVGIRELKNKLSHYLDRIKSGEKLAVTDRGNVIAFLLPAASAPVFEGLARLVREGKASWEGGKPAGSLRPVEVPGRPVSEIVVEDRR